MHPMMRASAFEFRHRVLVIALIFIAGFSCSLFDHVNAGAALARLTLARDAHLGMRHAQWSLHAVFAFAALLIAAGALIRTWAAAYLQSTVVHDSALHTKKLVADGPYRHVRNPLYLGTLLLTMGIGLLASRTGWFVLVGAVVAFEYRLIFREEAELLAQQGDGYRRFYAAVPRMWPALRPRVGRGNLHPRWRQAFVGESATWVFALALAIFAGTLNIKRAAPLIAAGGALELVVPRSRKRLFETRQQDAIGLEAP